MYSQSTKKHKALKIDSLGTVFFFQAFSKAVHLNLRASSRDADIEKLGITVADGLQLNDGSLVVALETSLPSLC